MANSNLTELIPKIMKKVCSPIRKKPFDLSKNEFYIKKSKNTVKDYPLKTYGPKLITVNCLND